MKEIPVKKLTGKNAISIQNGANLYESIYPSIVSGEEVLLDFEGVELFASPFFNASIGLVLKDIDVTQLKERVRMKNLSELGSQLLNHVISNAIRYYGKEKSIQQVLNERGSED